MCGIAGGIFWSGPSKDRAGECVAAMTARLTHRGPDGHGLCFPQPPDGSSNTIVAFGHTRLAILDTSTAGAQPMGGRANGPTITYNGEAYNFVELKTELERSGGNFVTGTDTESLLRGYETWGVGMVERLRGMFAFGLWDPATRRLLLARDRLGIKPLYYYRGDGFLLFSSEVRALLASGLVPRRLDPVALWQYLGYQSIPAPRTMVQDVRALAPGRWMTVDRNGHVTEHEYWNMLDAARNRVDVDADEARRRVGVLLREAVAGHMVSDVPVGAFLSGGIDSSAVVGLMREAGFEPRTFSVGFDERTFDESAHAALVARTFRTVHTHIPLGETELLDQLPAALSAMDQPTGDAVNTYVVSGAVRARGMTVALSGLGGDELFGGYRSFARLTRIGDFARYWGKSPDVLRSLAASAVRAIGGSSVPAAKTAAVLETDGSMSSMFPLTRQVLSLEQRLALVEPAVVARVDDRADPYERLLAAAYQAAPEAGAFAQISFAEARTYMHDVLLRDTDQMSMAHGLEVRVPLLDHVLVEYVMALPDACKQPNGTTKRLLVESLGGLLPDSIVHRPKQGFTLPFDPWMRGAMRSFCEKHLLQGTLVASGLVKSSAIGHLWRSFLHHGKDVSWSRLWTLVVLDDWLERNALDA